MSTGATHRLRHAAERATTDPFFLAHTLREVAQARGWNDDELAIFLDFPVVAMPRLLLCGHPRADRWRQDVERIAEHAGCDPERLAELLTGEGEPRSSGRRPPILQPALPVIREALESGGGSDAASS